MAVGVAVVGRDTFAANRAVGRIALTIAHDGTRSRRSRIHEYGPLRARFPSGDALDAVIINTAGGIAGGDRFSFDITVGAGAGVTLTTAAAEKIYRALDDDATVDVKLSIDRDATLSWLPQETILFNEARLRRRIDIDVAADGRLLFAEAVVFGRTAMGETVSRGRLVDRWRVRRAGELIFADTMRFEGSIENQLARAAVAAGGCAVGTVLMLPGDAVAIERARTAEFCGEVGISAWNGIALARLIGRDGESLRRDFVVLLTALGSRLPRLWLN